MFARPGIGLLLSSFLLFTVIELSKSHSKFQINNEWYTQTAKDIQNPSAQRRNLDSNNFSNQRYLHLPLETSFDSAPLRQVQLKLKKSPTLEGFNDESSIVVRTSFRLFSKINLGEIDVTAKIVGHEQSVTVEPNTEWRETTASHQRVTVAEWKQYIKESPALELTFTYKSPDVNDDSDENESQEQPNNSETFVNVQLAIADLVLEINGLSEDIQTGLNFENCDEFFDLTVSQGGLSQHVSLNNKFAELWSNPHLPKLPSKIPAWHPRPEEPIETVADQPAETPTEDSEEQSDNEPENEPNEESSQSVYQHPEQVDTYYYTDHSDKVLELNWKQQQDLRPDEDLCFSFAYFSSSQTQLKVSLSLPDPKFQLPADQDNKGKKNADKWIDRPALMDNRVVAVLQPTVGKALSQNQIPFEWNLAEFCARRDAQSSLLSSHLLSGNYVLQLRSVLFEEELKTNVLAVTEFHVQTRRVLPNPLTLLADWKLDGKEAHRQWHVLSENEYFQVKTTIQYDSSHIFQLYFRRPDHLTPTGYALISDWLWLNDSTTKVSNQSNNWMNFFSNELNLPEQSTELEGTESSPRSENLFIEDSLVDKNLNNDLQLKFALSQCVQNALVTIYAQNSDLTQYPLKEVKLDCAPNSARTNTDILVTIDDETKQKLDTEIVRLIVNLQLLEFTEEQTQAALVTLPSQTLQINEVQLLNACNQETNPCQGGAGSSSYGKCIPTSRQHFRCECEKNRHGTFCQFWNHCVRASEQNGFTNGDKVCQDAGNTRCKTLGNSFYCACSAGKIWNAAGRRCEPAAACTFAHCGLNEKCIEDVTKPNGFKCRCVPGHIFDESSNRCVPDTCKNACAPGQLCDVIPGSEKPFCYCPSGFRVKDVSSVSDGNNPQQTGGCEPISTNSPLIRQWLNCQHGYDVNGKCKCSTGYHHSLEFPYGCILDDAWKESCSHCNSNEICKRARNGRDYDYTCKCPIGLTGEQCDQDDYCSVEANAKEAAELCGGDEASGCELDSETKRFSCKSCPDSYTLNTKTGRCELRQDLCENNKCAAQGAVCQLQFNNDDKQLKSSCVCPPGRVRNTPIEQGGQCVEVCSQVDCTNIDGECVYDLIQQQPRCQCKPGYAMNSKTKKCELFKDALHVRGVLRVQLTEEKSSTEPTSYVDKQQIFLRSTRIHPKLDCSKSLDTISCLYLAKKLNPSLIGANQPELASYFRIEVEKTLNSLLEKMDDAWVVESGIPVSDLISQARLLDARSDNRDSKKNHFDYQFGFEKDYEVHLSLAVVGGELKEREKQWKRNCVRIPELTTQSDSSEEQQQLVATSNVAITDPNRCVIVDRLSWAPRKTQIGWLNLCHVNAHHCDRYSQCSGSRGNYKCECDSGFQSVSEILRAGFKQQLCMDIDECTPPGQNLCTKNTECENTLGSYRCNCKVNFKRQDRYTCEDTCTSDFPCLHGHCDVIGEHYEICRCYEGYRGDDCAYEDPKVTSLRNILISVAVGLGLLLLIVMSISFLFIQSARAKAKSLKRSQKHEETEMQQVSSSGSGRHSPASLTHDNLAYQSEQNLTRV